MLTVPMAIPDIRPVLCLVDRRSAHSVWTCGVPQGNPADYLFTCHPDLYENKNVQATPRRV
eukprot:1759265-Amphidinium_carterae.1